ncbi:ATP-binding cassette sub-family G member 1 [Blattella germanica]|nr:ATP-binding cassette sub-family G member 1 [Blattella germanica]
MTTVFQEEGFFCPEYYNRADFAIEVARKKRGKDLEKLVLRVQKEFSEAEDFLDKNDSMTKTSQKELSIEILDDDLTTKCKSFTISDLIVLTKRSVLCTYRDLVRKTTECSIRIYQL